MSLSVEKLNEEKDSPFPKKTQSYFCSLLHSFEYSALFYCTRDQLSKVIWPVQLPPSNHVKIPCMVDQGDNLKHLFWRLTKTYFCSLLHLFENSALFYFTGGQLSKVILPAQFPSSNSVKIPCMVDKGNNAKHLLRRITQTYFCSLMHLFENSAIFYHTHIIGCQLSKVVWPIQLDLSNSAGMP